MAARAEALLNAVLPLLDPPTKPGRFFTVLAKKPKRNAAFSTRSSHQRHSQQFLIFSIMLKDFPVIREAAFLILMLFPNLLTFQPKPVKEKRWVKQKKQAVFDLEKRRGVFSVCVSELFPATELFKQGGGLHGRE